MLSFLKKHGSMISKLFINQLGMAIFGLIVTFAVSSYALKNTNDYILYTVAVSIFSILFYLFLLLIATNEGGAKDKIRIDAGRIPKDGFLGAKWALAANMLNFLLAVVILITYFLDFSVTNAIYAFCHTIAMLLQAPYIGIIHAYSPNNPIIFLLIPLPAVAVSAFGYWLGTKGIYILQEKKKK